MKRSLAVAVACTLVFPAGISAQGSLQDSIAREATRAALTAHSAAQDAEPQAWNAVLGIEPNAPVKVISCDGRAIIGSFVSADAETIVIDKRWGRNETLSRTDVREIRMRPRRSTAGSAGIGFLSGYAAGATVGWIAGCSGPCTGDERAQGIGLVGAFGGSVGFWIGLIRGAVTNLRPGRLIYKGV